MLTTVQVLSNSSGVNRNVGVYVRSYFGRGMETRTLHVPPSTSLSGPAHPNNVPFVMVDDAAFPLKPYLRPYSRQNLTHQKRIFNYRLSRARMVLENAFGILASRWRIVNSRINLHPQHTGGCTHPSQPPA